MKTGITLILCLFFTANNILRSNAALKRMYMDNLCFSKSRETIYARNENFAGILINRPRYVSSEVFKCQVTLVSPKKSSIVLSLHHYDFSSNDQLTVEDSDGFVVKLIGTGTYNDEKKSFMSLEKMIISFTTRNSSSTSGGFQFTYTVVHDSPCYENEFPCKNGKCIPKKLVCNGHNHCGDKSDQIKCVPETPKNNIRPEIRVSKDQISLPIILLSVLALMLLIATISFIAVILKFARTKKQQTPGNSETGHPDSNNALQSIASTVPQQDIQQSTVRNEHMSSQKPQAETFYNRLRRSFRGRNDRNRVEEVPVHQETYQVPSMYPDLNQTPSAPEPNGIENESFKIEE